MWGANESSMQDAKGGGFMDTSQVGSGASDNRDTNRAQNVVPLMIGHLVDVTDDLTVWGKPVRIVTFVGIVRRIEQVTTKITYEIEDETGTISAVNWLEADKEATEPSVETGTYVRVFGFARDQGDKRHVLIAKLQPLEDLAELTTHLLEVTFACSKAKAMSQEGDASRIVRSDISTVDDNNLNGLNSEQTVVFKIIQSQNNTETGIERDSIKKQVPKSLLSRVDDIIEFLASEGHVYTTRTDDHFKTT